jgi:hypothetical protein
MNYTFVNGAQCVAKCINNYDIDYSDINYPSTGPQASLAQYNGINCLAVGFPYDNLKLNQITSNGLFILKKDFNYIFRSSFLILLFFSLLLISKTHEDFPSYHFLGIKEIFENKLTLGSANILITFAHISLFSYVQSLIVMPFYFYKFIHIPIFIIYFATLGYFYMQSKIFKIKTLENFFCNFLLIILIIKFTRLSEYGYDYISQFLLLIVFHKVFFNKKILLEISKSFLIFMLAVLIAWAMRLYLVFLL